METESSKNCLSRDECTKDLDLFFANGLYNSCQATDELIKSIEEAQDEALSKKALALYQRHYSNLERPWDHVTFMYGLGLIYMHFNAYQWAVKAFRDAIYVQPSFPRSRDVHTRLGLIFKATGRYKLSEKHFNLAINDTRPDSGTSTKLELEFQLAHLYEIQGKLEQAKEAYERLLQENDLPHQLSANIHRQLGWMCFTSPDASIKGNSNRKMNMFNHQNALSNSRFDAALSYLNTSYRYDSDPKTSYYLGRCFTNIGKFQDAFASYRSVIDREESTADTWCSIGVLYHQQNQPTDALQAYIRSVQFDKQHVTAWKNLGILYESHNQFHDALKCYQHVLRSSSNLVDKTLQTRIKFIQKQMAELESTLGNSGKTKISSDKLLGLEDLWNLESKTNSDNSANNIINNSIDKSVQKTSGANACSSVITYPKQKTETTTQNPIAVDQRVNGNIMVNDHKTSILQQPSDATTTTSLPPTLILEKTKTPDTTKSSTMESLFNNCANNNNLEPDSKAKILSDANPIHPSTPTSNHIGLLNNCKLEISTTQSNQDFKPQSGNSRDFCLNQMLTNGASKDSGISSNSSTYADCALVPSQNTNVDATNQISADQVIEAYRNSPNPKKIDINLLIDEDKPPHTFAKPPPYPPIPQDQLFPSPPSIYLETKKDLASKKLQDCCQTTPISIVRNIASVLKLDLGLFSTKTLVEINPNQQIDVLSHSFQLPGESNDPEQLNLKDWACERVRSSSTISRYASYQVASFRESIQDELVNKPGGSKTNLTKESETDSNESASAKRINNSNSQSSSQQPNDSTPNNSASTPAPKGQPNKKFKKESPNKIKYVKSANKIDLSDDKKWRAQLSELNKLPNFIKCVSASNILTHVGTAIPGINTILMSMHVPGCKILGNRTPNNFCSVSINVGPGDYEWSAISAEYGSILTRLCNRHGFELEGKNWWPKIEDLQKYNIPIYRFSQRPGDLVWVNSGTIYWVNATGWCNRIHWNVGPLCAKQYKTASESFELNKFLFRRSDVPMIQVTWNIIININFIFDEELYQSIAEVLRRSLRYCFLVKDLVDEFKKKVRSPDDDEVPGPKMAKFCSLCDCEVFNIYFTTKPIPSTTDKLDKPSTSLHCVECARRSSSTFDGYEIKQEYDLNYLMRLYDNFIETKRRFLSCHKQERNDN